MLVIHGGGGGGAVVGVNCGSWIMACEPFSECFTLPNPFGVDWSQWLVSGTMEYFVLLVV